MNNDKELNFYLKALTDIWTGGVDGKNKRLHLSGIKGSIRWWYEALIRGLNGYACDPNDKGCSFVFNNDEQVKNNIQIELNRQICPVCQLFGCTGWSGKVKILITEKNGAIINERLKKDKEFILKFVCLKPLTEMEKTLLNLTIKIIVEYGSVGGKTVLKPSDHGCSESHHDDYGLLAFQVEPEIKVSPTHFDLKGKYNHLKRKDEPEYPNIKYFWFIRGQYFNRLHHNKIVSRDPNDTKNYLNATDFQEWLGGDHEKGISKKIFSFKTTNLCWGYARESNLNIIKGKIQALLNASTKIIEGKDIMHDYGLL